MAGMYSYEDDKPAPPIRLTSIRDKNGPTSSSEKEKEKKKGWLFGKKNQGWLVVQGDILFQCSLHQVQ